MKLLEEAQSLRANLPSYKVMTLMNILESLPFVEWDRFTVDRSYFYFFGWIEREKDNYKDFVVLVYDSSSNDVDSVVTSSVDHSLEISMKLFGAAIGQEVHND